MSAVVWWRVSSKRDPTIDRDETESSYLVAMQEAQLHIERAQERQGDLPDDLLIEVGRNFGFDKRT